MPELRAAVHSDSGECPLTKAPRPAQHGAMTSSHPSRFLLAWLLPLAVLTAALNSAWAAWLTTLLIQLCLAVAERFPGLRHSPPAASHDTAWHRVALHGHVVLQAGLLATCLAMIATRGWQWPEAIALGIAVGGVTGGQGITMAHELGHSRSRLSRLCAWLLMSSVNYSHFMVEHYRGHHVRAATHADPATARKGESLWRFLPRSLIGSFVNAWALEAQQLRRHKRTWVRSPLLWSLLAQLAWLAVLFQWLGFAAFLFWCVQSMYAVFLLEAINYIEHYGLVRQTSRGKSEAFDVHHAWNADHFLTNCFLVNLQRHSDHHMHAWKPFATLQALPGPQLPTGYAGCLFLALIPSLWFGVIHKRLAASAPSQAMPYPAPSR